MNPTLKQLFSKQKCFFLETKFEKYLFLLSRQTKVFERNPVFLEMKQFRIPWNENLAAGFSLSLFANELHSKHKLSIRFISKMPQN